MTRLSHDHDGKRATVMSLALLLLAGCGPDAKGKFEEFLEDAEPKMDVGAEKMDLPAMKMDMGPPTDAPVEVVDISGQSLLALATKIDPTLPLQFLSTITQRTEGDKIFIDIELQPLSLTQGKVTVPREPVGDKLVFKDVPVVDGKYSVSAEDVMVVGAANPVTGSDIVATLKLDATIVDSDFVCGSLSGMLKSPLEFDLMGSEFAAERVEGVADLPTEVTINCKHETRTEK